MGADFARSAEFRTKELSSLVSVVTMLFIVALLRKMGMLPKKMFSGFRTCFRGRILVQYVWFLQEFFLRFASVFLERCWKGTLKAEIIGSFQPQL